MEKLKKVWDFFFSKPPVVEPATFEKWEADGVCANGEKFTYRPRGYVRVSGLTCDAPEFLADAAKDNGYYRVGDKMYYMENIVSLTWRRVEQICNVIPWIEYNFQIYYMPEQMFATIQAAKKLLEK